MKIAITAMMDLSVNNGFTGLMIIKQHSCVTLAIASPLSAWLRSNRSSPMTFAGFAGMVHELRPTPPWKSLDIASSAPDLVVSSQAGAP